MNGDDFSDLKRQVQANRENKSAGALEQLARDLPSIRASIARAVEQGKNQVEIPIREWAVNKSDREFRQAYQDEFSRLTDNKFHIIVRPVRYVGDGAFVADCIDAYW